MKFVEIDEILNKMPNKYATIVLAAKEARKIIEARKPPPLPKESDELPTDPLRQSFGEARIVTAVPEADKTPVETGPKKRGRKPKKLTLEKMVSENNVTINETSQADGRPLASSATSHSGRTVDREPLSITENKVVAEKEEENPYMAALRKVVKR